MRGRFPLGRSSSGTGSSLGQTGGNSLGATGNLSLPSASFSYSWAESPPAPIFAPHTHTWSGPWGLVAVRSGPCSYCDNEPYGPVPYNNATETGSVATINKSATSSTINPSASVSYGDPPYAVVRYIVATANAATAPCGAIWGTGRANTNLPSGGLLADGVNTSGCLATAFSGVLPDLRNRFPCWAGCFRHRVDPGRDRRLPDADGHADVAEPVRERVLELRGECDGLKPCSQRRAGARTGWRQQRL